MWVSAANRMALFNAHKTPTKPMVPSCAFGAHITSYVGPPESGFSSGVPFLMADRSVGPFIMRRPIGLGGLYRSRFSISNATSCKP